MEKQDLQSYWNKIYEKKAFDSLGWYEEYPEQSLKLIEKCGLNKDARIINVGTGASTLIDSLLNNGYNNIIASDISFSSMKKLKERLGALEGSKVQWIVDDLANSNQLTKIEKLELWHDRAVLHFLTEKNDQDAYFTLLNKLVKKEGFVIIAVFNTDGATMCSGLPVVRYSSLQISNKLGEGYELKEELNYTFTMPSGDTREYVYTLFRRS